MACIVIGLAMNVLVAWTLAVWRSAGGPLIETAIDAGPDSVAFHKPDLGWSSVDPLLVGRPLLRLTAHREGVCVVAESAGTTFDEALAAPPIRYVECRFGWPAPSLGWHQVEQAGVVVKRSWSISLPGLGPITRPLLAGPRRLPLEPVWHGLLFNTAVYAAVLGALEVGLSSIGAAQRRSRRERGYCPVCAYDLHGDFRSGCPECGWDRPATKSP
ncbi:MAG: hypothetical protein IT436_13195 [Phycisphaerales bacterium]|nr:hypothetical protein [Phycisphaerales bacterium]